MLKIMGIVLTIIFLLSTAQACLVSVSNETIELRGTGNYYNVISAEDNDEIDIKINFDIDNVTGSNCPSNITAKAKIYHWDNTNEEWDLQKTINKTQTLEEDTFTFTWSNEFTIDDRYNRYKVEGYILEGTTEIEQAEAYVDVENNTCSAINLVTHDYLIDEGRSQTKTFVIENNTNKEFRINNLDVSFSTSIVSGGDIDYDTIVRPNSSENITVELNAVNVSYDRTGTGVFKVSGYLENTFCSETTIGRENFEVKVIDTGNSNTGTNTSSYCDDIKLVTKDITLSENNEINEVFYLENNSTKRFEITDIELIDSGVNANIHYFEQYAFPGNIADLVINLKSVNVTQTKTYEQKLRVSGKFSDGKTCSFNSINESKFNVTVENQGGITFSNCNNFSISVNEIINAQNFAQIPFTITNGTNNPITVYVEGTLEVTPTVITLPSNSSISRELNVNINTSEGTIVLRPVSTECNLSSTTIKVFNTAQGNATSIQMSSTIERNENDSKLIIKFDNPTNKTFVGVIEFDLRNELINDRTIGVPSGESFTEVNIENAPLIGKVRFISIDGIKELEIDETKNNQLTGLFGFVNLNFGAGLLLLIIIIAIVIVIVLTDSKRRIKEQWETKNE